MVNGMSKGCYHMGRSPIHNGLLRTSQDHKQIYRLPLEKKKLRPCQITRLQTEVMGKAKSGTASKKMPNHWMGIDITREFRVKRAGRKMQLGC